MYRKNKAEKTQLSRNTSYEGETIEQKIQRIVNNKEPIKDGAPLIYTNRKDGVQPQYDIRTDRFEIAIGAMDKVAKTYQSKRQERIDKQNSIGEEAKKGMEKESGEATSTEGTK